MGWFVLWILGMVAAFVGIIGTAQLLVARSGATLFGSGPYTAINVPGGVAPLLLGGTLVAAAGLLGIWRSRSKTADGTGNESIVVMALSTRERRADTLAMVGLIAGSTTLLIGIIPGASLALWPIPISVALICWLALGLGTRLYRRAILGLTLSSVAVLLSAGIWLAELLNGNGSFS